MSQSQTNTIRIPSPTDRQALALFEQICAGYDGVEFAVSMPGVSLGTFRTAGDFVAAFPSDDWDRSRTITSMAVTLPNSVYANFQRTVTIFGHPHVVKPDAFENEIWFYGQNGPVPKDMALNISRIIDRYRQATEPKSDKGQARDLTKVFGRQMADLASLQTQIVVEAEKARKQQEEDYQKRVQAFEIDAIDRR